MFGWWGCRSKRTAGRPSEQANERASEREGGERGRERGRERGERERVSPDVEACHPRDEDVKDGGLDCLVRKTVPILYNSREDWQRYCLLTVVMATFHSGLRLELLGCVPVPACW